MTLFRLQAAGVRPPSPAARNDSAPATAGSAQGSGKRSSSAQDRAAPRQHQSLGRDEEVVDVE